MKNDEILRMLRTGTLFKKSAIFDENTMKFSRMLRMGAQFASQKFSDFEPKIDGILNMFRTGAQFTSEFSGCSAWRRDFERRNRWNFEDALHGEVIFDSGMNFLVNSRNAENGDFCTKVR